MIQRRSDGPAGPGLTGSLAVFFSLAALVCGMTLLFLAMRSVMEIGGSCGSDGVHQPIRACPEGAPLATLGGIFGGAAGLLAYIWASLNYGAPSWAWLAWPGLLLPLGWNFLEFGLDPPGGGGFEWGWLVCGVLFWLMGGVPLVLFAKPLARAALPIGRGERPRATAAPRPRREPVQLVEPTYDPQPTGGSRRPANNRGADLVSTLERLSDLHRRGALTDEEFEAAKERVLEEMA